MMKKLILALLILSVACDAQIKPTSNFGRTANKGTTQPALINLDTYFDVLNLQGDKFSNFTLENPNLVSTWKDLSSNVNNAVQATSSLKPLFNTATGVKYNGINNKIILGSEITLANGTIFIVFKNDTDGSSNALTGALSDNNNIEYTVSNNGIIKVIVNNGAEAGEYQLGGQGLYKILMIRKNSTTWTVKYNDRTMGRGAAANTLSNGSIKISGIGFQTNSTLLCNGNIKAIMVSSSVIDDATCTSIRTTLMARYNIASATDISILGFGDSITQNEVSYPVLSDLATLMGLPHINCGLTGTKASNATGAANNGQDRIASEVVTRPYKDKIYIFFGANDIGDGGITTANFQSAYDAMVTTLVNAGYSLSDICLVSPPYRKDYNSTYKTREDAFVAAVLAVATARHTHYANVLQPILDTGTPDTYMFDNLHPTAAGAQIIANTIYAGFNAATL